MADFPEALDRALSARYEVDFKSPASSVRGRKVRMAALEAHFPTKAAAANAVGVAPSTWRTWNGKRKPSRESERRLHDAYLSLLRAMSIQRKPPKWLSITATVVCDPQKAQYKNKLNPFRTFNAKKKTGGAKGTDLRPMMAAWAGGQPREVVAAAAQQAIKDVYGNLFAFEGNDVTVELHFT